MEYKNHVIVASALKNDATQQWVADTTVSWTDDGQQYEQHIRALVIQNKPDDPDYPLVSFASREQADHYGTQEAKAWIDRRLKSRVRSLLKK